ncbi:MerR family transcriptional regulator, partial [Christensenellaceae bacterium OttesenSCG-928-M15]|nr:MerR family transcriptional regulator [Christensenellaceae bacterium OttesenSCG-928-M15]
MEKKPPVYGTYKTSQIAKYYGMTNKGLEFYEEKGILTPEREENGKYRVYHLEDCYTIYGAKLFRRVGFSVEETLQMVNCKDAGEYREKLLERKRHAEREARVQERLAFHMEEISSLLEGIEREETRFS